jgi:hypothetical protein
MKSGPPARPRAREKSCNHPGLRAVIYFGKARVPKTNGDRSWRTTLLCMNAFFAHRVTAIRDWCHRTFQTTECSADASQAASGKGNWSCFFSAAHSAPAPMIQRPTILNTTNIGTGADMDANKWKPSIVRIIRVRRRRRRPAGESRFLGEFAGRKIANS